MQTYSRKSGLYSIDKISVPSPVSEMNQLKYVCKKRNHIIDYRIKFVLERKVICDNEIPQGERDQNVQGER